MNSDESEQATAWALIHVSFPCSEAKPKIIKKYFNQTQPSESEI